MKGKKISTRMGEFIDSPKTDFLYYLPIIGGIKSYRLREQARLLSHASDNLDEMSYRRYYKLRSVAIPIIFEATKLGTLYVAAHGLTKPNLLEFVLGGVGYGFSSKIQSDIEPKLQGKEPESVGYIKFAKEFK